MNLLLTLPSMTKLWALFELAVTFTKLKIYLRTCFIPSSLLPNTISLSFW